MLYIPDFKHNLLLVGRLLDHNNLCACFERKSCFFQDLVSNQIKAMSTRESGLYRFNSVSSISSSTNNSDTSLVHNTITSTVKTSVELVHARLGHKSASELKHVIVSILGHNNCDFTCEACVFGKHHKLPYPVSDSITSVPFELIHVDLWGKYRRPSLRCYLFPYYSG